MNVLSSSCCCFLEFFLGRFIINKPTSNQNKVIMSTTKLFEELAPLPGGLFQCQYVPHKNEILICGGYGMRDCYSYHLIRDEYKSICSYPDIGNICGHCVIKLASNDNNLDEITLLSFGGRDDHTLIMKYVSVWDDEKDETKHAKAEDLNKWVPLRDKNGNPLNIGSEKNKYEGVRAVIGGKMDVFDLRTFEYIKHYTLPIAEVLNFHCFVLKAKVEKKNEMVLFCGDSGLSIVYDEDSNNFELQKIRVCSTLRNYTQYGYVYANEALLLFGGRSKRSWDIISQAVHKYYVKEDKWITFEQTLPSALHNLVGILSEDNIYVHIFGRQNGYNETSIHIRTKWDEWIQNEIEEKEWILIEKEIQLIERVQEDLEGMKQGFNIGKLKDNTTIVFTNLKQSKTKTKQNKGTTRPDNDY
ncbi:hypothetical protein RFI_28832 [Reticulomyxa filosa]|uniref:Uncharacterized protein n=1 Tax=Reticulomyxa filosa TaxID=46433 RepID=X6M699_RETFI|nr:hypothetical protein RFI_28832 [Reticulomyxa filosa]|eukprot:ETO08555.1 hypothetical protein RFI_28832 [Reticulomyxa filosa]